MPSSPFFVYTFTPGPYRSLSVLTAGSAALARRATQSRPRGPAQGEGRGVDRRPGGRVGRAFASVFANPALRRINLAHAASVIGDWAYAVAVSVWAYQQGGATAVGVFGVARYVVDGGARSAARDARRPLPDAGS